MGTKRSVMIKGLISRASLKSKEELLAMVQAELTEHYSAMSDAELEQEFKTWTTQASKLALRNEHYPDTSLNE